MTDEQIIDGLAEARFADVYRSDTSVSRLRAMREEVSWDVPFVKQMMAEAYREGQDAGYEECLADAEGKSPNPYEER